MTLRISVKKVEWSLVAQTARSCFCSSSEMDFLYKLSAEMEGGAEGFCMCIPAMQWVGVARVMHKKPQQMQWEGVLDNTLLVDLSKCL